MDLRYAVYLVAMMCLILLLGLASGCAAMSGGPNMSVDQLKAIAADKNANVTCSTINGMWGAGKVVVVNMDAGVVRNGQVSVDANCLVTITNAQTVKVDKP